MGLLESRGTQGPLRAGANPGQSREGRRETSLTWAQVLGSQYVCQYGGAEVLQSVHEEAGRTQGEHGPRELPDSAEKRCRGEGSRGHCELLLALLASKRAAKALECGGTRVPASNTQGRASQVQATGCEILETLHPTSQPLRHHIQSAATECAKMLRGTTCVEGAFPKTPKFSLRLQAFTDSDSEPT